MADSNFRSYRRRDTVAREDVEPSREAAADPLAELARLIGQGDPYGERHDRYNPGPADHAASGLDWAADQSYADEQPRADERAVDDRAADARYTAPLASPYHESQESYSDDEPPPAPRFFSGPATNFNGFREQPPASGEGYGHEAHAISELPPVAPGRQLPAFASPIHDKRAEAGPYEGDQDHPVDDYDDANRPRRRSGVALIMAVLGLVVVGSAGAFGYRAMFGGSVLPTLPPIIKASNGPNKIVLKSGEATASGAGQRGAASADATEKLAPPPEQPLDVQQSVPNTPRVVATIPIVAGSNPIGPVVEPPPGPAPVGAAPSGAMPFAPANPSPASVAPAPSAAPPMAVAPARAADSAAAAPRKVRTVAIHENRESSRREQTGRTERAERAERRSRTRAAANAPLSIVPGAAFESRPMVAQSRPAMEPRRRAEGQPMALASAGPGTVPVRSSAGGYAVQVTSQRSEAEAKAAFRMLRSRYPAQFGRREPIIRRADLGSKGLYYRAFVGPFPTLEAAAEMCSSLKAAGGNCLISRN